MTINGGGAGAEIMDKKGAGAEKKIISAPQHCKVFQLGEWQLYFLLLAMFCIKETSELTAFYALFKL